MKPYIVLSLLISLMLTLTFVRTYLIVDLSTSAYVYSKYVQETNYYKRQNILIKEKILKLKSLPNIAEKADKEGYVKASYYYIYPTKTPDKVIVSESTTTLKDEGSQADTFFAGIIVVLLVLAYHISVVPQQFLPFYDIYAYMHRVRHKAKKDHG